MGLFGGNNKNTDENAAPSGSKPPHGRRLSQSMINTETGKFMSKLINESSYLSGTGETNTFDTAEAVAESDELMREMFFSICLLYTSPSPRDATLSRMPSSA